MGWASPSRGIFLSDLRPIHAGKTAGRTRPTWDECMTSARPRRPPPRPRPSPVVHDRSPPPRPAAVSSTTAAASGTGRCLVRNRLRDWPPHHLRLPLPPGPAAAASSATASASTPGRRRLSATVTARPRPASASLLLASTSSSAPTLATRCELAAGSQTALTVRESYPSHPTSIPSTKQKKL